MTRSKAEVKGSSRRRGPAGRPGPHLRDVPAQARRDLLLTGLDADQRPTPDDQPTSVEACRYHARPNRRRPFYANMPVPIYKLRDRFTAATRSSGSGHAEARTETPSRRHQISTSSHEISESLTTEGTAWFDSIGFEIGDECNFVFGPVRGRRGVLNQTMAAITPDPEEFRQSRTFAMTGPGLQGGRGRMSQVSSDTPI